MSTIVGVRTEKGTAVAWDEMVSVGPTRCVNATHRSKVSQVGDSLIGIAGLMVYQNILEHYTRGDAAPRLNDEGSLFEFFLKFWRALHDRYHLVDDQSDSDASCPFADLDAEFLVANRSGLFLVKQIMSVARYEKFCAIGSGAPHAEGALQVLYRENGSAADIAEEAVRVALEFDRSSGGPVNVRDVPRQQTKGRKKTATRSK